MALRTGISIDEFLAQPEEKPYHEYLYGRVVQKAMPKRAHSILQSHLGRLLWNWCDLAAGGEVMTEPRCILSTPGERHVQLPDVSWFAKKPNLQDDNVVTPPELAVEILSSDDPFGRVQQKIRAYLAAGVGTVWIVDPSVRTVSVCCRSQEPALLEGSDVLEDPMLPGLSLSLIELFKPLGDE